MRKKASAYILYVLFYMCIFSQTDKPLVEFYGAVTSSISDKELIRPIQDLLYSYLNDLNTYAVIDKRDTVFSTEQEHPDNYIFFMEIDLTDSTWTAKISLLPPETSGLAANEKISTYENYNKLLLDTKASLQSLLTKSKTLSDQEVLTKNFHATLESFAGNWQGEDFIDRIVILRPGRGFVFFRGGASMPVNIIFTNNELKVVQSVKSNASFYPDIPRSVALTTALTANPIEWVFTSFHENYLEGYKKTLQPIYQDGIAVATEEVTVPVIWTKIN